MGVSNGFDRAKQYQEQEDVFFDDGREVELLHFVYSHSDIEHIRGSPRRVLAAIDEFARTKKYLMNVGEDKGKIVVDLIQEVRPKVMVEFGGYVGYSCILFGDALRTAGGQRYWSLEKNPEFAAVILALVNLAGLSDVVKVMVGNSDESVKRLHANGELQNIGMAFLDHYKPAYLPDLKLCEELGMIGPGSVLAADNVVHPGNPDYLAYVRSTCTEKRQVPWDYNPKDQQYSEDWSRSVNQYKDKKDLESLKIVRKGRPDLQYESQLIDSYEPNGIPDGVEVTRCVGVES